MKAYEINGYTIAAKNKNQAYYQYLEEENNNEDAFDNGLELEEGEEEEFTVTIRRLTQNEVNRKNIRCHNYDEDDCETCAELDDYIYSSIKELMDQKHTEDFPCVIAKED